VSQKLSAVLAVVDWKLEFAHGALNGSDLAFQIFASLDEVGIGTSEMTFLGVLIQELEAFKLSNLIKDIPSVFLGGNQAKVAHYIRAEETHFFCLLTDEIYYMARKD